MKSNWIVVIVAMTAMPCLVGSAGCVTVRMQGSIEVPFRTLQAAQLWNTQLFHEIGVALKWAEASKKSSPGTCAPITLEFSSNTPASMLPGALAFATPYQLHGTRIRIFVDRVLAGQRTGNMAELQLGYVMAHEIGHILQGVSRHSETGVMKACVPGVKLITTKLAFAREDIGLIHAGLSKLMHPLP